MFLAGAIITRLTVASLLQLQMFIRFDATGHYIVFFNQISQYVGRVRVRNVRVYPMSSLAMAWNLRGIACY